MTPSSPFLLQKVINVSFLAADSIEGQNGTVYRKKSKKEDDVERTLLSERARRTNNGRRRMGITVGGYTRTRDNQARRK